MRSIQAVREPGTFAEIPENGNGQPSFPHERPEAQSIVLPYLQLFWDHRKSIFRAALRALVISVVIALLIPVRYQSVSRLMPPDDKGSGLGMLAAMAGHAGALDGLASDLLGMKNSSGLFVGILHSETVQDAVITKFNLQKVYRDSKIEDARKDLDSRTDIAEDRKSGIISVAVTDHDPNRAAAMAQAYVTELDRLVAQVSTSSARRERQFLEQRLQAVKADLDTAARNFSDFASKNGAIDIPAQGKAMVEAAATLQGELIAAQAELSGLQQVYSDQNYRVRSAEARVHELQKKLNEIGGGSAQTETENTLYPSIRRLPVLGVTYADLYRETKIQETVYELLTQQYELAKVQEAKEIPTVKVLDNAQVPTKKTYPPRTAIVILGTMMAMALVMAWIVGKEQWNAVDAADPRKVLANEVFTAMRASASHFARNGAGPRANGTAAMAEDESSHPARERELL